jgi:hypothetical protein
MARIYVPLSLLSPNHAFAVAHVAVDPVHGHYVASGRDAWSAGILERVVVFVANASGSSKTVTVRAGVVVGFPVLSRDLTATVADGAGVVLGPFDSVGFVQQPGSEDGQSGGRLFVDFQAGFVGTVTALGFPS